MNTIMKSMRTAVMLTAILLSGLQMIAQNASSGIIPDTPPSPQAVAFNRLGDYQVSNNYGAPDISIPLFEIDHHGYKIPLTLRYEASPLKPGYNYDVTGIGWTLSGNSCVSRTIKDMADEDTIFHVYPYVLDSFQTASRQAMMYTDYADKLDKLNYQYDSYNIVLPSGRTIPFFMYRNGHEKNMEYILMPSDSNVKITCSCGINSIDAFTVTDESGVKYRFTVADKASDRFDNEDAAHRNVTWLLTTIDIPSKGKITYEYNDFMDIQIHTMEEPVLKVSRLMTQMPEDRAEERLKVSSPPQPKCPRYRMRLLRSISYGPTRIDFNYYNDRQHMSEIVVSDCGNTIRKFTLGMAGPFLTSLVISGQDDKDKLVYGFSYQNKQRDDNDSLVKHTDYWGNICYSNTNKDLGNFNMFFNNEEDCGIMLVRSNLQIQLGRDNLAQLIDNKDGEPYYYYKLKLQSTANGDTRKPTPPEYHGVLSSITYPKGGHTAFTWENHRFPTATAADGDFVFDRRRQRIIEGGGFRIKSVINYSADGKIASEDHYRYGFTYGDIKQRNFPLPLPDTYNNQDHIGCGEAVVDPNLLTFMSFTYYKTNHAPANSYCEFQKMLLGMESEFRDIIDNKGSATWWDACFSANTFQALLGGRRPVVYPEITVYHGNPETPEKCQGKTVYKYDIYSYEHNPSTYYLSSFNQTDRLDTAYFERVYYDVSGNVTGLISDEDQAAKRHQLKNKSEYSYNVSSHTWELVSEEKYSYNEEGLSKNGWMFNSCLSKEYRSKYVGILDSKKWLEDFCLSRFYIPVFQKLGRSTLSDKSTTFLRHGGTRTQANTLNEEYSYLYSGVLKERDYTDLPYGVRDCYDGGFDKKNVYSYVGEEGGGFNPVIAEMKSRNMLASLVSAETFTTIPESSVIAGTKIDYKLFDDNILPSKLYERNGGQYEESVEVLSYDACGNPTEIIDLRTGVHSVFLWDTYGRYLIAVIKNAEWKQVQSSSPQLMTGTSQSRYNKLKALLPDAQIQTWAYSPLIGVSSHTDTNGQTTLYEYDGLGRLKSEKRTANGHSQPEILSEYDYNFLNPSL